MAKKRKDPPTKEQKHFNTLAKFIGTDGKNFYKMSKENQKWYRQNFKRLSEKRLTSGTAVIPEFTVVAAKKNSKHKEALSTLAKMQEYWASPFNIKTGLESRYTDQRNKTTHKSPNEVEKEFSDSYNINSEETIPNLYDIWSRSGKPKINTIEEGGRAFYTSYSGLAKNAINISVDDKKFPKADEFMAEAAHGIQHVAEDKRVNKARQEALKKRPELRKNPLDDLKTRINKDLALGIHEQLSEQTARERLAVMDKGYDTDEVYNVKGTLENTAHFSIEPPLLKEALTKGNRVKIDEPYYHNNTDLPYLNTTLEQFNKGGQIDNNMAKKKGLPRYQGGGQLGADIPLQLLGSTINQAFSSVADIFKTLNLDKPYTELKPNTQPFAKGGEVNGFKQYNTGGHGTGNDQNVSNIGVPTSDANATGTVQNKENLYNGYVFSDILTNPDTGNKFNVDMKKLVKKFKKADTDFGDKEALNFSAARLAKINDIERSFSELGLGGKVSLNLENKKRILELVRGNSENAETSNELGTGGFANFFGDPTKKLKTFSTLADRPTGDYMNPTYDFDDAAGIDAGTDVDTGAARDPLTDTGLTAGGISDIIKGAVTGSDLITGLTATPEKVDPRLADYTPARTNFNAMSSDMDQARQDAAGVTNQFRADIDNTTRSSGVRNARLGAAYTNLQDVLGRIGSVEKDKENKILAQRGQFETVAAQDDANRLKLADTEFSQNKATADMAMERATDTFSKLGDDYSKKQFAKDMFENRKDMAAFNSAEGFMFLNTLATDFGIAGSKEHLEYLENPTDPAKRKAFFKKFEYHYKN